MEESGKWRKSERLVGTVNERSPSSTLPFEPSGLRTGRRPCSSFVVVSPFLPPYYGPPARRLGPGPR